MTHLHFAFIDQRATLSFISQLHCYPYHSLFSIPAYKTCWWLIIFGWIQSYSSDFEGYHDYTNKGGWGLSYFNMLTLNEQEQNSRNIIKIHVYHNYLVAFLLAVTSTRSILIENLFLLFNVTGKIIVSN